MRRSVLIIHPGAIGDVLLALPAIRAIRDGFPEHECILVAGVGIDTLLRACHEIDRAVPIEGSDFASLLAGGDALSPRLRAWMGRCDLVVCWVSDPKNRLSDTLRGLGARDVIVQSPFQSEGGGRHQSDRFLGIVRQVAQPGRYGRSLCLPEAVLAQGSARLSGLHAINSRSIVALHPGSGSRHKCSPPMLFAAAVIALRARDCTPVLLGGPADEEALGDVLTGCQITPAIIKDLDLLSMAGVLAHVALFVGHDSGLTHLAAALQRPTIALFGPTDIDRWAPRGTNVSILTGEPCRCQGWAAVQSCQEKPCLHISVERLLVACEERIRQDRQAVHASVRGAVSPCSAR